MKYITFFILVCSLLLPFAGSDAQYKYPSFLKTADQTKITNKTSEEYMPVIGVWVWNDRILLPDGYKSIIDQASMHSPFNLLIPFLRFADNEVVDNVVFNQVKLAAEYALEQNIALVPDLDVRSARRNMQKGQAGASCYLLAF